jgi:hypothetical protein
MESEVLVLPNGDLFSVWDIHLAEPSRSEEKHPCEVRDEDGTTREGILHVTVESSDIDFVTPESDLESGLSGQLSASDGQFYEMTIENVEKTEAGGLLKVSGTAVRRTVRGIEA